MFSRRLPSWNSRTAKRTCGRISEAGVIEFSRTFVTLTGNDFNSSKKEIVDALRSGERCKASILLSDFGARGRLLSAGDFMDILKCCAKLPDPLFAMETWKIMEEKEIGLNNMCHLFMVRSLCKAGHLEEGFKFLKSIGNGDSHGMCSSLSVYNCFLSACLEMQNMAYTIQCLDLMENRLVGKNEATYKELLKIAVWKQNSSGIRDIWQDYMKWYPPRILFLQNFVRSYAKLGDIKSAHGTLQYMLALAAQPYNGTAKVRGYSKLDIPIPSDGKVSFQELDVKENYHSPVENATNYPISIEHGGHTVQILKSSFDDIIHACAVNNNCVLAEQLMLQMQDLGLQPCSHTYAGIIRAVVSERGITEGLKLLNKMRRMNLTPCNSTLALLSIGCSRAQLLNFAEILLDQISNYQHPRPFNSFLEACATMGESERAFRMLTKMRCLKIKPDVRTYEILFSLFGPVNAPYEKGSMLSQMHCFRRIKALEMDMGRNGVQHSYLSMKNLLKTLGAEGMMRELMEYFCLAENLFCRINTVYLGTPIYNTVLHSLVEAKESSLAVELFNNMKSNGLPCGQDTYCIMLDCCALMKCYSSACAFVSLMLRSGFYPPTLIYTVLTKILLEEGNFDEAFSLLDQSNSDMIQPDVIFYNAFLKKASAKDRIDVMEHIIEEMHRKNIQPDPTTCRYVFCAYAERGFHITAIQALQVLSMRMIFQGQSDMADMKMELEHDLIFSEDSGSESRIFQFFEEYEEKKTVALLCLRWCAILAFSISWSPNETLWATRLSSMYDARNNFAR